jgi:subtilisin family serine protease
VVIDSGVHAQHPHVQGVAGGIGVDAKGALHEDYVDRVGHGTAVTAVIREKAPEAQVFVARVFDRELSSTGEALVAALRWAVTVDARLVSLSLGTTNGDHEPALRAVVDDASRAGAIVVAAGPQEGTAWLPGRLPGVVAVSLDLTLPRDACTLTIESDGRLAARASGYPRPIAGVPPERNLRGLSFAVANTSGLLARVLQDVSPGVALPAALARLPRPLA